MIRLSLIIIVIVSFNFQTLTCQNSIADSKLKSYCKFLAFSKYRESIPLDVFYFTNKNKRIRSSSGFNSVNFCNRQQDSIKTVSVWATNYFLRILKSDYSLNNSTDSLFLTRLSNDSLSKIEGIVFTQSSAIDLYNSKIALDEYAKFIIKQLNFKFFIVASNNEISLKMAEFFFSEITKINATLKYKLAIEKKLNPKLSDGIYLKALRQKK